MTLMRDEEIPTGRMRTETKALTELRPNFLYSLAGTLRQGLGAESCGANPAMLSNDAVESPFMLTRVLSYGQGSCHADEGSVVLTRVLQY